MKTDSESDSEGGACDSAVKFINMIYAKPKGMSIWDTEGDRLSQKKTLIDTLSSVLAKHRARDKIFMGLKRKRSNERQVHQVDLGQIQDSVRIISNSQGTGNLAPMSGPRGELYIAGQHIGVHRDAQDITSQVDQVGVGPTEQGSQVEGGIVTM